MEKPSIGRIVHYNKRGVVDAAIVVAVHSDDCVSLVTWNAEGIATTRTLVMFGTDTGQWSLPARV